MIPKAPMYDHTPESLEALAKVIPLCQPAWPCFRKRCKRCKKQRQLTELGELLMGGDS